VFEGLGVEFKEKPGLITLAFQFLLERVKGGGW
jgi:hypothetical protein